MASALVATVAVDLGGTVVAWNEAACELFGYRAHDAIGAGLHELVVAERVRPAWTAALQDVRTKALTPLLDTPLDLPAVDCSGRELHVEMVVSACEEGFVARFRRLGPTAPVPVELYLAAQGYQHRGRVETARINALIEALNVGVLLHDEDHRIVLANAAFTELLGLGLPPEDLRGRTDSLMHAVVDRAGVEARMDTVACGGVPVRGDEVLLADGRVIERDYVPVKLDGTTLGHLWVFHDVTAQAEIRRGLERRNRMLTEVSDLKTEFVRVASHELRTPLTSIGTFAGMLEFSDDEALDPADRRTAITAIRRNAERMQILVADLLLLAQLESGETPLRPAPVDLAALLRSACAAAGVPAIIGNGPVVTGDEPFLRQLLGTAVGVVAVAADPSAPVTVAVSPPGWTITVGTVTAEPATVERLLSTRLPHPDCPGEHRTGALALMLAREIAARHNGTLSTSVTADGLTVTLTLPT
jgi:PAS domain S-box-containing protein